MPLFLVLTGLFTVDAVASAAEGWEASL